MDISSFGYILSASFMCAEKHLLSRAFPQDSIIRLSVRVKFGFIVTELILVILFLVLMYRRVYAPSVVLEWIIGLVFALYMWSCVIDFFAVPEQDEKSGAIVYLNKSWDEEIALAAPRKLKYAVVHEHYIELP